MVELLAPRLMTLRKDAMKNKKEAEKRTLQSIGAAFKQRMVDEKIEALSGDQEMQILVKIVKQRRDSLKQYLDASRQELADIEQEEIDVIESFMPKALTEEEVAQEIEKALKETGATEMSQMGQVMAVLKERITGRADMGKVSGLVRKAIAS